MAHRKWEKEDDIESLKMKLYSEIIGVGSYYVGEQVFRKINDDVAKALLICGNELAPKLIEYMACLSVMNKDIKNVKNPSEVDKITKKYSNKIAVLHEVMTKMMRDELKIKD